MKIGVFIGRMQPLHLGHQKVINESIKDNDLTLIFLGSSGVINNQNPFSDLERENFLKQIFLSKNKYIILKLQDEQSDELWIENIGKKIANTIDSKIGRLTFYGGDFENDYAIKILKRFEYLLGYDDINYKEISRKDVFINHKGENKYISSTLVRDCLIKEDLDLLEKLLDKGILKYLVNKNHDKFKKMAK